MLPLVIICLSFRRFYSTKMPKNQVSNFFLQVVLLKKSLFLRDYSLVKTPSILTQRDCPHYQNTSGHSSSEIRVVLETVSQPSEAISSTWSALLSVVKWSCKGQIAIQGNHAQVKNGCCTEKNVQHHPYTA